MLSDNATSTPRMVSESELVVNRVTANAVSIQVRVVIEGRPIHAVIDSGAEVSVLSEKEFDKLPESKSLRLTKPDIQLVVADQERRLPARGVVEVEIRIHDYTFHWPVYIASISDGLLLGSDILDSHDFILSQDSG